jgi:hypothetical protein
MTTRLLEQLTDYIKARGSFSWDNNSKRFRDTKGKYISQEKIEQARQSIIDSAKERNLELAQKLVDKKITLQQWEKTMRDNLRKDYTLQYLIGKGGRNNMTQRDWSIIGRTLQDQYKYLGSFASDIKNGRYTDEQIAGIANRSNLYSSSSGQAYMRGMSEAWETVTLPHYPRDGSTICLVSCLCFLEWKKVTDGHDVTWHNSSEACPGCKRRNGNTVKIRKGKVINPGVWG